MASSFFRRVFGVSHEDEELLDLKNEPLPSDPPIPPERRHSLAEMGIAFYTPARATIDISSTQGLLDDAHQQRIFLDYYAETLYRLSSSEQAKQLHRYIGELCSFLLEGGELKRVNILGDSLELLLCAPEEASALYYQKATLFKNGDGSLETEYSEPILPEEYYLPSSVMLCLQHLLYSLADAQICEILMALSAMHTFHASHYSYVEPEGYRLATRHALHQLTEI